MKKMFIIAILAMSVSCLLLTGCSSKTSDRNETPPAEQTPDVVSTGDESMDNLYSDNPFSDLLSKYQTSLVENWDLTQCYEEGLNGKTSGMIPEDVGFEFQDIFNCGSDMLLIGDTGEYGTIYDIFAISDGVPYPLISIFDSDPESYYLYKDGYIACDINIEGNYLIIMYKYDTDGFKREMAFSHNLDSDKWFYYEDADSMWYSTEGQAINVYMQQFEYVDIQFTPFSSGNWDAVWANKERSTNSFETIGDWISGEYEGESYDYGYDGGESNNANSQISEAKIKQINEVEVSILATNWMNSYNKGVSYAAQIASKRPRTINPEITYSGTTATVTSEIEYWFRDKGGSASGSVYAVVIIDTTSGKIISSSII